MRRSVRKRLRHSLGSDVAEKGPEITTHFTDDSKMAKQDHFVKGFGMSKSSSWLKGWKDKSSWRFDDQVTKSENKGKQVGRKDEDFPRGSYFSSLRKELRLLTDKASQIDLADSLRA